MSDIDMTPVPNRVAPHPHPAASTQRSAFLAPVGPRRVCRKGSGAPAPAFTNHYIPPWSPQREDTWDAERPSCRRHLPVPERSARRSCIAIVDSAPRGLIQHSVVEFITDTSSVRHLTNCTAESPSRKHGVRRAMSAAPSRHITHPFWGESTNAAAIRPSRPEGLRVTSRSAAPGARRPWSLDLSTLVELRPAAAPAETSRPAAAATDSSSGPNTPRVGSKAWDIVCGSGHANNDSISSQPPFPRLWLRNNGLSPAVAGGTTAALAASTGSQGGAAAADGKAMTATYDSFRVKNRLQLDTLLPPKRRDVTDPNSIVVDGVRLRKAVASDRPPSDPPLPVGGVLAAAIQKKNQQQQHDQTSSSAPQRNNKGSDRTAAAGSAPPTPIAVGIHTKYVQRTNASDAPFDIATNAQRELQEPRHRQLQRDYATQSSRIGSRSAMFIPRTGLQMSTILGSSSFAAANGGDAEAAAASLVALGHSAHRPRGSELLRSEPTSSRRCQSEGRKHYHRHANHVEGGVASALRW